MAKTTSIFLFVFLWICYGCQSNKEQNNNAQKSRYSEEELIKLNQLKVKEENYLIEQYIERTQLDFKETGTGLRYRFLKNTDGDNAKPNTWAEIAFKVSLLNGTVVYSSAESGNYTFLIAHDEVESGIHEGIQLMSPGDKALFILPSHLAHGLAGDQQRIPPNSPLLYEVELLSLRER